MEEAGFVDVVEVIYKWPMNRWPANKKMKEIGTSFGLFSPLFHSTCFSFSFHELELDWVVLDSLDSLDCGDD
jgi:hypothetical protein